MKKAEKAVLGTWRITGMEVWDADYFDMEAPAHITVRSDLTGEFQFGLVQGDLDARVSSGRGWMVVTADQAEGRIFIHLGDDSAFTAVRSK